jgi:putative flippase GtrA
VLDFTRHADRAIYVLIAVMAVTVALEGVEDRPGKALAYAIGTALALTLAELFADRVGISIRSHRPATGDEIRHEYREALTGLVVVALPISMLLLAALDVIELDLAFILAQWIGFAILAIYSYVAARAAGGSRGRALLSAMALTAIGGALIGFNALIK